MFRKMYWDSLPRCALRMATYQCGKSWPVRGDWALGWIVTVAPKLLTCDGWMLATSEGRYTSSEAATVRPSE